MLFFTCLSIVEDVLIQLKNSKDIIIPLFSVISAVAKGIDERDGVALNIKNMIHDIRRNFSIIRLLAATGQTRKSRLLF